MKKKNRGTTVCITPEVHGRLKTLSKLSGMKIGHLVETAIDNFLIRARPMKFGGIQFDEPAK
jgi:hypothetical protein